MVWKEHSETSYRTKTEGVVTVWMESDVWNLGNVEVAVELPLLEGVSQLGPLADDVVSVAQPHIQGHHRSFLCKRPQHR